MYEGKNPQYQDHDSWRCHGSVDYGQSEWKEDAGCMDLVNVIYTHEYKIKDKEKECAQSTTAKI